MSWSWSGRSAAFFPVYSASTAASAEARAVPALLHRPPIAFLSLGRTSCRKIDSHLHLNSLAWCHATGKHPAGHHRPAFTPATTRPAIPRAPPRVMFRSVVALCGCQSRGLAPVIFLDREGAGLLSDRNSPLFTIPIRRVMGTLLVPEDDPIIGGACAR